MMIDTDAVFDQHIQELRASEDEKTEIPKAEVPELPDYFEEYYPANGMQNEGALASYRDDKSEKSIHVIEYETHWEAHIDEIHPDHDAIGHLREDAPGTLVGILAVAGLFTAKHYGYGPFGN